MLLTGDIEARSEGELFQLLPPMTPSDVLVVPHHGSRTSPTPAFIAGVAPIVAIFAAGYRNRFGHPRDDVVARYRDAGALAMRTDTDGAITVTLAAGRRAVVVAERVRQRRYWYDKPYAE